MPNGFAQLYWEEVKGEIVTLVQGFHEGTTDLSTLNRENIMMISKIDASSNVKDFRPISIINIVPKIISKLLATRIDKFLSKLIPLIK